jgi:flagellar basal-body rod modification protein FlgD
MSTTYTTLPLTSTTSATATKGKSALGKDDFLKLLIVQLQNQDPMDPMKGTEFATQLAQFSSVEQLSNISSSLTESISANQVMTQSINNALAATMIGKTVKASSNSFNVAGSGEMNLGFNLAKDAATVTVKVYDDSGTLVRTMTVDGAKKGDGTAVWDGLDKNGRQVAAGTYSFSVEAVDAAKTSITATAFVKGTITGIRFKSEGTVFVVDGVEIPLSQIIEIVNGKGNG